MILSPSQGFSSGETDFHFHQFLSNFFQYLSSIFLSSHPNKIFAIYFPSNSFLLNLSTLGFNFTLHLCSTPSCLLTSALIFPLNSSTNSLVFSKSSFFSQVSFSAVNSFHCTRYLSILCIFFYLEFSLPPILQLLLLQLVLPPPFSDPLLVFYIILLD